ncbi:isochorismatase [Candidatus Epulonipiscioides gigas]|nr:isochorismatase [Epulopiscium sp. SCG-C07WGA-EpuloA2]
MKKALIIIDYVYDFVADDGKLTCGKAGQNIEKKIIELITQFNKNEDFIVVATDNHELNDIYNREKNMFPEHCIDNKGRALYGNVEKVIDKNTNYLEINKNRYSAFCATALDLKLKERNVDEIHLVGVCTDICILHTAIEAYNLGYKTVIYKDAVASFNEKGHNYALDHFKNVLLATVL